MRVILCAFALVLAISAVAVAAEPAKVSVNAQDELLSAVVGRMAKDAGVNIVVDPRVDTKINISLGEAELPKILDSLTKVTKSTWKRVQFAKPTDSKVTLDQIESSIVALASMPLIAVSIQDGSGKGAALMPSVSEAAAPKLPEGYSWSTAYVIYNADQIAAKPQAAGTVDKAQIAKLSSERLKQLAAMTPEERQKAYASEVTEMMTLVPEARQQMIKDQFSALQNLDPQMRQQYFQDMRSAMRGAFGGMRQGGGNRGNRGNRTDGGGSTISPAN